MGKWRWGVILDAGSSGTRVHVYRWLNSARARQNARGVELYNLPDLETKPSYTKKIHPGVSAYAEIPSKVGPQHLQELLDHALAIVPANQIRDTPIFLMATAGVRLLEPTKQNALLSEICSYAQKHTEFSLPDCNLHIQVIPGETEGLYGWIAANYLLKGFQSSNPTAITKPHTYGFLDMGGASAQLAFAPNATETEKHANDLKLVRMRTLNGDTIEYKVFTTTWLGFGVNQARERYVSSLMDASYTKDPHELLDPCLPSGLKTTMDGKLPDDNYHGTLLLGTGLFDECLRKTYPLLDKDAPCTDQPCLLHGQHVPEIDWNINHFVGVSEYWYTTHEVFASIFKDKKYDLMTYKKRVKDFCSEEWHDIDQNVKANKWGKNVDAKVAQQICFKASWLISVLHDGIGVPRTLAEKPVKVSNSTKDIVSQAKPRISLDSFQAINEVGNMEVSWTLGKMVLYAAGQIPPSDKRALPVGFGPNLGSPEAFQEAGSNIYPILASSEEDSWTEAAEELAEQAHFRFTPGFLFFLLLIGFFGYIFRKQDRRTRLYRFLHRNRRYASPRKNGRGFLYYGCKYFGSRGPIGYAKVLDDDENAAQFELGENESDENEKSDSSGRSQIGRTSGLAAPKVIGVSIDSSNPYFEGGGVSSGDSLGLGIKSTVNTNTFHRAGLAVRAESRERSNLAVPNNGSRQAVGAGRRSRTGSPTRGKIPTLHPLEED
ncbi:unnamed protein product [Blumeria hordei]|uniref:Apyrase n=1 Tax=Blumeria hordei TaxID=2867405 RepID=A0A383V0W7_BLUHO|nr:unnamed protein product [Blumeria hordei]